MTQQPENLRYAETHEWVRVEGDDAVVGISDYAQDELGDVVYLDLPWSEVGTREVRAGEHFGDIESVKTTSELFAPVSGTIVRINEALRDAPEGVNVIPTAKGGCSSFAWRIRARSPADDGTLRAAHTASRSLSTAGAT